MLVETQEQIHRLREYDNEGEVVMHGYFSSECQWNADGGDVDSFEDGQTYHTYKLSNARIDFLLALREVTSRSE